MLVCKITETKTISIGKRVTEFFKFAQKRAGGPATTTWPSWFSSNFWNISKAGVEVNWDSALQVSTFYACVKNISEDIGKLPINLYQEYYTNDITTKYLRNTDASAFLVRKKPNQINSGFDLISFLIASAAMNGNGYAYIKRDAQYNPIEIYPIWANDVIPLYVSDGTMRYNVLNTMMRPFQIPSEVEGEDMIHIKGLSIDGCTGVSVIRYASETLGGAISSNKLANNTFANGAMVGGVLEFPNMLSDDAYNRIKSSWDATHAGPTNAGKTAILEEGGKFSKVTMSPEDSQLLQSRQFQVVDICRWFRMPPHKVQDLSRSTFSNIEHQAIEYVQDCLMPWAAKIENEFERKLLHSDQLSSWNFRFDYSDILRGDAVAQADFVAKMVSSGTFTLNDARRYMYQNPIAGGDETYVPINLITLDQSKTYYTKPI